MEMIELMRSRHSVRQYKTDPIEQDKRETLLSCLDNCNKEGKLHLQLMFDEPKCFDSILAHYGKLINVNNYIAMVGRKADDLEQRIGYYGERMVIEAQKLGLNTCWVALSYAREKCVAEIGTGERLVCVISLGYGATQGIPHRSKDISELFKLEGEAPSWFSIGMEAAMLAPTAMNQQKFKISLVDGQAYIKSGSGIYTKIDLGIVRSDFEASSGKLLIER